MFHTRELTSFSYLKKEGERERARANSPVNSHQASQRTYLVRVLCHRTLAFILSAFPQGATQVLLLRTQINGTCCYPGSRRFLPFSPPLTPTHPLNFNAVLTDCSDGPSGVPGRGETAGPIRPCTTTAVPSSFHRALGHALLSAREGSSGRGRFLWEASTGRGPFGPVRCPLPSMHKAEAMLSTKRRERDSPQARVLVEADLASPSRGCARRLQHARPSQAPSCHTIPIFLVSINSGTIFKYTKA